MSREDILRTVRTALGRTGNEARPAPPPVRLRIPEAGLESRVSSMIARVESLAGRAMHVASTTEACDSVGEVLGGRTGVASQSPYLEECGITRLKGVRKAVTDRAELREMCATADVGITSADYALADTGTLVMLSSASEARMISLLPPAHIAVVPCERLLTGLDELFSILPDPAAATSSMVLITGPSRTADIEQILVRGVHGPGEITVILVGSN